MSGNRYPSSVSASGSMAWMSAGFRAAAMKAFAVPRPLCAKSWDISSAVRPSGNVSGSRYTSPFASRSMTAAGDAASVNRYSPALSERPLACQRMARRNVSASRTTPAAISRRPMPTVLSPGGISTNCSPVKAPNGSETRRVTQRPAPIAISTSPTNSTSTTRFTPRGSFGERPDIPATGRQPMPRRGWPCGAANRARARPAALRPPRWSVARRVAPRGSARAARDGR